MNTKERTMYYKELTTLNDKGGIDTNYLGYDIYRKGQYYGTISRVTSSTITIDSSGAYAHSNNI